jgi:hypothetical protein
MVEMLHPFTQEDARRQTRRAPVLMAVLGDTEQSLFRRALRHPEVGFHGVVVVVHRITSGQGSCVSPMAMNGRVNERQLAAG